MIDIYQARRQDGKSDRSEVALRSLALRKGSVMRTAYLRWILPVLALLLMATALVIIPAVMTHAAGTGTVKPTSSPAIATPTPAPSQTAPNTVWFNG